MTPKNESLPDLINRISDDAEFNKRLEAELAAKRMGRILFAIRNHRGYSQTELAERMACSQSRVSKLEHSYDASITLGDLTEYARALDLSLTVSFHNEMNAAESIKYHALQIKRNLDKLTHVVGDDTKMLDGLVLLYQQLVVNIGYILAGCVSKLPTEHRNRVLQITAEPELIGEEPTITTTTTTNPEPVS